MRVLTPCANQLKLDAIDWKILAEIRNNIRQPLTKIASKCLLSRQRVEYRLEDMRNHHLITGSRAVINIRKLGFKSYHVFIEAHTPEDEKMLLQRATAAEYVNAIILYSGKYNFEISIIAKNEEEFLQKYVELVHDVRLREDQVLVLLRNVVGRVLPNKFIKNKPKEAGYYPTMMQSKHQYTPDRIDQDIMYMLSKDALMTNVLIGEKVKLSKDAVKYRLAQLEKSGYIVEYRPAINYSALGLSINAILIKLNYNNIVAQDFETFLKSEESVLWCSRTFGYYDYLVYTINSNLDDFHATISRLKQKFSGIIKTYDVLFAYEEVKYEFMSKGMIE